MWFITIITEICIFEFSWIFCNYFIRWSWLFLLWAWHSSYDMLTNIFGKIITDIIVTVFTLQFKNFCSSIMSCSIESILAHIDALISFNMDAYLLYNFLLRVFSETTILALRGLPFGLLSFQGCSLHGKVITPFFGLFIFD